MRYLIPCTGDFELAEAVTDQDKVVDIYIRPIIAWIGSESDDDLFLPIPCDEPWPHDCDNEVVVKNYIGYTAAGEILNGKQEMIDYFQKKVDDKLERERKKKSHG